MLPFLIKQKADRVFRFLCKYREKKLLIKVEHGDFDIAVILTTNIFSLIRVQCGRIDKSWHRSACPSVFTQTGTNMFVCACLEGLVLMLV